MSTDEGTESAVGDAELLDAIYSIAIDPTRYEDLVVAWEVRRRNVLRSGKAGTEGALGHLKARRILNHLQRADQVLDRFAEHAAPVDAAESAVASSRHAALVFDAGGRIVALNPRMRERYTIAAGDPLGKLPLSPAVIDALVASAQTPGLASDVLRFPRTAESAPLVMHWRRLDSRAHAPILLTTAEFRLGPRFGHMLQQAFGLTGAELEVLTALTEGTSATTLAATRHRSEATIRTQIRSLLAKTETHSQVELVRLVIGLVEVAEWSELADEGGTSAATAAPVLPYRAISLPDGRRFDYLDLADPNGRPFVWLFSALAFARFPQAAEDEMRRRGIRLIVPVRAGYGFSSPAPQGIDPLDVGADDVGALLDALEIDRAPIVSLGQDLCVATRTALRSSGRISAIIACGPVLPGLDEAAYDRMQVWQKFINGNARFAPAVLPFIVKAGFMLARRVGKPSFAEAVFRRCAADLEALADPEIRTLVETSTDPVLGDGHSAQAAFVAEALAVCRDWSGDIAALNCPLTLFVGHEDPDSPIDTVREFVRRFNTIRVVDWPGQGRLVVFTHWRQLLALIEETLDAQNAPSGMTSASAPAA